MFFITTKTNDKITGKVISGVKTQEDAEEAIVRLTRNGGYIRDGETFFIFEANNSTEIPCEIKSDKLVTADEMKAAILGSGSVMNSDF